MNLKEQKNNFLMIFSYKNIIYGWPIFVKPILSKIKEPTPLKTFL